MNTYEPELEPEETGLAPVAANLVDVSAHSHGLDAQTLGAYLVQGGDVSELSNRQRAELLAALAKHVGLDPLERPFMIIKDGKAQKVYARAACADGLSRTRGIDTEPVSIEETDVAGSPCIVATVKATTIDIERLERLAKAGVDAEVAMRAATRSKTMTGVVPLIIEEIKWKKNDRGKSFPEVVGTRGPTPIEAANLRMKAETKAERRAVLKLVGLGIADVSDAPSAGTVTQLKRSAPPATPTDTLAPRRAKVLELLDGIGMPEHEALAHVDCERVSSLGEEELKVLTEYYRARSRTDEETPF